jgi:hypothetical protein
LGTAGIALGATAELGAEWEKPMITTGDVQANRDTAEPTAGAPHQTDEARRHFLVPWRLKADAARSLWQQGNDVGCGSGPV